MTHENQHSRRWWGWALLAAVALVAAYGPAMQGSFLMSDQRVVAGNPRLESFAGLLSVWWPAAGDGYPIMDQYQPLTYTLFWLERQSFGHEARAYQLVSVALHALNGFLVWQLLSRIGARGAGVAAALFAFHAVHVESVAWIYEQKNVLSGVFFFLALLAYLRFEEPTHGSRRSAYVLALGCFAAALLAKSSTVVLPALIVLYAWFRGESLTWKSFAPTLPFFGMAAGMAALTIWYEGAVTGASDELFPAGALERVVRAGWIVGFHAGKVLLPQGLAFFYPSWVVDTADWIAYLPDLAIAAVLALAWSRRERWGRPLLLGLGWYLALMFPVLGFFDIFYHQFSLAADHFQYLASVGLIALLVHAAVVGLEKWSPAQLASPRGLAVAGALAVVACWFPTWQRSHVFASTGVLARDAADKYPTSWLAFKKSGESLLRQARRSGAQADDPLLRRAVEDLERAVALHPEDAQNHDLLGTAYFMSGNLVASLRHSERAVALAPTDWNMHRNLAGLFASQGWTDASLAQYRTMVAVSGSTPTARLVLARALVAAGRVDDAHREIEAVIEQVSELRAADPRAADLLRRAHELKIAAARARGSGS